MLHGYFFTMESGPPGLALMKVASRPCSRKLALKNLRHLDLSQTKRVWPPASPPVFIGELGWSTFAVAIRSIPGNGQEVVGIYDYLFIYK